MDAQGKIIKFKGSTCSANSGQVILPFVTTSTPPSINYDAAGFAFFTAFALNGASIDTKIINVLIFGGT